MPSTPAPLTVCILTKNEEARIARCLHSLQNLAAEIILLDSGSTDRTVEIASSLGANVQTQPWLGMAAQRQTSLTHGTQPWILALDADEEVTPELAADIRTFLSSSPPENAATFPRLTWFLGRWIRHGDWYPDTKLRLIRRGTATVSGSSGHDEIHVQGPVKSLPSNLYHYSFENIPHYLQKMSNFAILFETEAATRGKRWGLLPILTRPIWRFFRAYIIRRGFLDGFAGFWIALSTAYFTFLRYSLIREREHSTPKPSQQSTLHHHAP